MPNIPVTQKFHTVSGDVDTENKGSALANSNRAVFTMQDIINTVDSAPGSGTIGGSITAGQIAFGAATANTIEGNANITTNGITYLFLISLYTQAIQMLFSVSTRPTIFRFRQTVTCRFRLLKTTWLFTIRTMEKKFELSPTAF